MLVVARADIEFQLFLFHLDVTGTVLRRFEIGGGRGHLRIERLPLQRQAPQLGFDLPNFLSAILQNEQLLQFDLHARMLGARDGGVNHPVGTRPSTMQALIPPKPKELLNT